MNGAYNLYWQWMGDGQWEADSCMYDENLCLMYRIAVCDDGTFDISDSDSELIGTKKCDTFDSLSEAKFLCQSIENTAIRSMQENAKAVSGASNDLLSEIPKECLQAIGKAISEMRFKARHKCYNKASSIDALEIADNLSRLEEILLGKGDMQ